MPAGTLRLEEKQAAAATGQIRLAHAYQEALARHGITVAQVLLTLEDTEDRRRHLNARATLATLLKLRRRAGDQRERHRGDPEIRFGDNDRLAARVAAMIGADALVLLSDIDGLYTADPKLDPAARHIPEIAELSPGDRGHGGRGSARLQLRRHGDQARRRPHRHRRRLPHGDRRWAAPASAWPPSRRARAAPGSSPPARRCTARKKWIAGALKPVGSLTVDDGALKALSRGKSLLPAGVVAVEGRVRARRCGARARPRRPRGGARALGLFRERCARIMGHKSREIEALLGYRGRDEMIHRDDLVVER